MIVRNYWIWALAVLLIFIACSPELIDQPDRIVLNADSILRAGPSNEDRQIVKVKAGTRVYFLEAKNNWYRVKLPSGETGWIYGGVARPLENEKIVVINDARIRRGPGLNYGAFAIVKKGKQLESRAEKGDYYLVDLIAGKSGWISKKDAEKISYRNLVVSKSASIYAEPDLKSRVLVAAAVGAELIQLDRQGNFYQVRLGGGTLGWIEQSKVEFVKEKTIQVKEQTFIRRGADLGYGIIETVEVGMQLTYLRQKDDWFEVKTPSGKKGWIHKDFVETTISKGRPIADERPVYVITNQDSCNVRQGWGTDWVKIAKLGKQGTMLMKIGQKDDWLRVKMPSERIGWIWENLVTYDINVLITKEKCNIRLGYSTNFKILDEVPRGTPLVRISEQQGWTRVYLIDGQIGWIKNDLFAALDSLLFANTKCRVRGGPGTQFQELQWIDYGTFVYRIGKDKNWYKIKLIDSGKQGYVRDDLLDLTGNQLLTNERVNFRKGASTDFEILSNLPKHTRLTKKGEENGWIKVDVNGKEGWLSKKYVSYSYYPVPAYSAPKISTIADGASSYSAPKTSAPIQHSTTPRSSDLHQPSIYTAENVPKDVTKIPIQLRTKPDTTASIVTTLPSGTTLKQFSSAGEWWEVMTVDGMYGWVHNSAFGIPTTGELYVKTKANVRYGPGTNYRIVATVAKGEMIYNIEKRGDWYNIRLANKTTGWIRENLVDVQRFDTPVDYNITAEPAYGIAVTNINTELYKGPSYEFPILRDLTLNTYLTIIGTYQKWSQVQLLDGQTGWVHNDKIREKLNSKIIVKANTEVRRQTNMQSDVIGELKVGNVFRPNEERSGWYSILFKDKQGVTIGWIESKYVETLKYPPIYVKKSDVNIYRLPEEDASRIAVEREGTKLIPIDDEGDWLFVKLPSGVKGWINKNMVDRQKFPWLLATKNAEIYEKPTAGSLLKGKVTKGEKFLALEKEQNWYKISIRNNEVAWIYAGFVAEQFIGTQLIKAETNLRMGPGVDFDIIEQVPKGEQVKYLEEKSGWRQVQVKSGEVGWIKMEEAKQVPMAKLTARQNDIAYREPGFNYPSVGRVVKNNEYKPIEKKGDWYKIQLQDGVFGYAHVDVFEAPKRKVVFTLDAANIYKSTSASSGVIQKVEPATDLVILGSEGQWYHVELTDGKTRGYIRKELVFE